MVGKNKSENKNKSKNKKRNIIVGIIISFIVVIIAFCTTYYNYVKDKIYTEYEPTEIVSEEKEKEIEYTEVEGINNILLIGTDARELNERARADSIIIATVDSNNKEIRLTSLFRDTLVDIPGYGEAKLNAAMAYGGKELLMETIKQTYGIKLDKFIIINFWGFETIIDKIGGLEIDVKDYQLKELNKYIGESTGGNDCPVTDSGLQVLNGKQALSYARIRKGVGDEYERTQRQREVIFKVVDKVRETNPSKYLGIMNSMLDYISTNIEPIEALNLAYTIFKFPSLETKQIHIPVMDLTYDLIYKNIGFVFIMDREQNKEILHDFIFEDIMPDETKFDYDSFRAAVNEYKQKQEEYEGNGVYFNEPEIEDNSNNSNKQDTEEDEKDSEIEDDSDIDEGVGESQGEGPQEDHEEKPQEKPEQNPEEKPEDSPELKPENDLEEKPEQKPEEIPDDNLEETPEGNN